MRSKPSNAGASYSLPAFHVPECVLVAIALLARTAQFRTELSRPQPSFPLVMFACVRMARRAARHRYTDAMDDGTAVSDKPLVISSSCDLESPGRAAVRLTP